MELEPFHSIEGRIVDPLNEIADELTRMIMERLFGD